MTEPDAPRAAAHAAAGANPEPMLARALVLLNEVTDLLADAGDLRPTPWDRVAPYVPSQIAANGIAPDPEPGPTRVHAAGHAVNAARLLLHSALGDEMPGGRVRRAVSFLADATKCAAAVVTDGFSDGPPK